MIRLSVFLMVLLFAPPLLGCSCIDAYQPLPDLICELDTTGGVVLELRILRTTPEGAYFGVEAIVAGNTERSELFFRNGNGADCGWGISDRDTGERYLYIGYSWQETADFYYTFSCGYSNNLYRLNQIKTSVEYPFPGEGEFGDGWIRSGGLSWQDYRSLLAESGCDQNRQVPNPLDEYFLAPNPGMGQPSLFTVADEPPALNEVQVFDTAGRRVYRSRQINFSAPLPLDHLAPGIYWVVLYDEQRRKALAYHRR